MDSSKSLAPSRTIDLRVPEDSQQQRNQNYVEGQREEQQQGEQEAQGPLQVLQIVLIYLWEVCPQSLAFSMLAVNNLVKQPVCGHQALTHD